MRFDRPPASPPNANHAVGVYLENVYVGHRILAAGPWQRHASNICRETSEDAVTWNVLVGLLGDHDLFEVESVIPGTSKVELPLREVLLAWNHPVEDPPSAEGLSLQTELLGALKRVEAGRPSEIDAICWSPKTKRLAFIESKLTSGPGPCRAVATSYGVRDPRAACRLFRTNKAPAENGCSYWGSGIGGVAFTNRFPTNLVDKYLNFARPVPGQEEQAPCGRLYQLMRNAIVGRELATRLGAEFSLTAIVSDGYFVPAPYTEFNSAIRDPSSIRFGVITWQGIRDALKGLGASPDVAEYLKHHSHL